MRGRIAARASSSEWYVAVGGVVAEILRYCPRETTMNLKRISIGAFVLVGCLGLWALLRNTAPAASPVQNLAKPPEPPPSPLPPAPSSPSAGPTADAAALLAPANARTPPRPAPRAPALTEPEIMQRLGALGAAQPAESLALAREGNRRFKDSASAPERASIIVKSLSSLGRHDEAREEARKMERDYPDSDFTHDVHHHMFSNPPTHPTERGYGKKLEIE